jgi:hypothetical protein
MLLCASYFEENVMLVSRSLFFTLAVTLLASPALSQSINVPDYNFLNPVAPTTGFQTTPSTSAGLGGWQVSPPPSYWTSEGATAAQWYDSTGVFYNDPSGEYITNLSGSQAGFMFDNPGLVLSQTLSSTYQVGKSYQLTVGIGGGSNENAPSQYMAPGTQMEIGLFYQNGGNMVLVGTDTITWNSTLPAGYVTSLTDYQLTIPTVAAGNAWAGQPIGVALIQPNSAPLDGSYWDVDNVRVSAVPEPGTIALLVAGLGAFVVRRRWSLRKQASLAAD